jgi:hypothetical protein
MLFFDKNGNVLNWSFRLDEQDITDMLVKETNQVLDDILDIRYELGRKTYDSIISYMSSLGLAEVYIADGEEPF